MDITRINHAGLRVRDLEITRAFYEKLGFVFLEGPVGPEPVAIMEHPSGVNFNFILNGKGEEGLNVLMDVPDKHPGYTHVALEVPDLAAARAQLEALDIPLSGGPIDLPDGASMMFIRDPDRNVIEFHQPGG